MSIMTFVVVATRNKKNRGESGIQVKINLFNPCSCYGVYRVVSTINTRHISRHRQGIISMWVLRWALGQVDGTFGQGLRRTFSLGDLGEYSGQWPQEGTLLDHLTGPQTLLTRVWKGKGGKKDISSHSPVHKSPLDSSLEGQRVTKVIKDLPWHMVGPTLISTLDKKIIQLEFSH